MQSQEAFKVKESLDFLLDKTYQESGKYKKYHLAIEPKELKSKHGDYFWETAEIRIFNLSRRPAFTMMTCLHELAHHIQLVDTGNTDHTEVFYTRYYQLLVMSIALGWVNQADVLEEDDSPDRNKIQKLYGSVEDWTIPDLKIKNQFIITVKNGFPLKDYLRANDFEWFTLMQAWQKSVDSINEARLLEDILYKKDRRLGINVATNATVIFDIAYYLLVKNGYEQRKELRRLGYSWQAFSIKKCWVKQISSLDYKKEISKAQEVGLAPQLFVPKSRV